LGTDVGSARGALRVRVAVSVALVVTVACKPPKTRAPPPASIDVEFSGCSAVKSGPVCELSDTRALRLWVPPGTTASARLAIDGTIVRADAPRGEPFPAKIPDGARSVSIEVDDVDGVASRGSWRLALAPREPPLAAVASALDLRSHGRLDEAQTTLAAALDRAPPGDRGRLLSALGRVEFAGGHIDEAASHWQDAMALHEAEGRVSAACDDAFATTFLLLQRHRFSEARAMLGRASRMTTGYPDGRVQAVFNEGLLAAETGDHRTAMRMARDADVRAARIGSARLQVLAREEVARQLYELGRYDESLAASQAILESSGDDLGPCDRADLLDNVGWVALMAREHAPARVADVDARGPIARALALFRERCPDPNRTANALANLALAHGQEGRLAEAHAALDSARRAATEPATALSLFVHDLEGRLALLAKRPAAALASFARELDLAAAVGGPEDQMVAHEGAAQALVALGRRKDALVHLDRLDELLDATPDAVPLGEGRDTYLAARERGSIARVDLLLAEGRHGDALRAARRARARLLARVEGSLRLERLDSAARATWADRLGQYVRARAELDADSAHDWELSADKLARARAARASRADDLRRLLDDALAALPQAPLEAQPRRPAPGELQLAYFPSRDGWTGFADDGRTVRARALGHVDPAASPQELATILLEPFHDAISAAHRIRVLSEGSLARIDVHALPVDGAPLLSHAPVEYVLDVDGAPRSTAPAGRGRTVAVVADPTSDLASARAEARSVARAFEAAGGWKVLTLVGPQVTGPALQDVLREAELLHYGGHGTFGGPDAFESTLPLGGGADLTVADVLALPRVPRLVLLFGCETARDAAQGGHEGLGLAPAFVAAGADAVVATPRVVDDDAAAELSAELHRRLAAGGPLDVAGALREAELAVRADHPKRDWSAFRVLVP
jgi:tetratricopeptide (TPR) repeat protein